jgi:hypothetical protein
VARYLIINGPTTYPESSGALSYFSPFGHLFIGDSSHPVAAKSKETKVMIARNMNVEGSLNMNPREAEG